MDSFEKKIEQYKQELVKYAQKHGNVYGGQQQGFEQVKPEKAEENKAKKIYNAAFVSNRPMPNEYDGSESIDAVPANVTPGPDTDNLRNSGEIYNSYEEFAADNSSSGKLRVQAYAARQVFPIQNAKVTVIKEFVNGNHTFAEVYTDIDGIAQNIILPTKNKALSQIASGEIPYATYTVTVTHPRFMTQIYENVPIFDSIESMQPVTMLPLSSINSSQITPEDEPRF